MDAHITDLTPRLDAELRARFSALPPIELGARALARGRRELERLVPRMTSRSFVDELVPRADGGGHVRIRVCRAPSAASDAPALLWMHGGAWTLGGPEVDDHWLLGITAPSGAVAVSVDYRLAPEHPFPCALDDCLSVWRWLLHHMSSLRLARRALCIGGSSAGANLAAGLCLALRDAGEPLPARQLLLYPALDDRLATRSMLTIDDPRTISREFMRECWRAYLRASDAVSPHAAPARARDLRGLPPASILTAELDPLRDEALDYAARLEAAGNACTLHVLKGAVHGCEAIAPESGLAARVSRWVESQLTRLKPPEPGAREV